ncbi:MAG: hypothetical protein ACRDJ4_09210 [Actinomycetota bacterium]
MAVVMLLVGLSPALLLLGGVGLVLRAVLGLTIVLGALLMGAALWSPNWTRRKSSPAFPTGAQHY